MIINCQWDHNKYVGLQILLTCTLSLFTDSDEKDDDKDDDKVSHDLGYCCWKLHMDINQKCSV